MENLNPLAGLTRLRTLTLGYNRITQLRPLSTLSNLEQLLIDNNMISDLTPLTGLGSLTLLDLVEELQAKGVEVVW